MKKEEGRGKREEEREKRYGEHDTCNQRNKGSVDGLD
jgi:hypothetical protein